METLKRKKERERKKDRQIQIEVFFPIREEALVMVLGEGRV